MEEKLKFDVYRYCDKKYSIGDDASIIFPILIVISILILSYINIIYYSFFVSFLIIYLKMVFFMIFIVIILYSFTRIGENIKISEYEKIINLIKNKEVRK